MSPFTLHQLISAVRGQPIGAVNLDARVERIETDSRKIRRGDLFWALRGERFDGHAFLGEAASRGAVACVAQPEYLQGMTVPSIAVEDTLYALWDLAAWYRNLFEPMVIGVTGSVGKTTTRHLLHTVLSQQFPGVQNPANFNNHIGLPLSLLGLESRHEFAVLEMGASQRGEIRSLAALARPEVAVLTRIAPTHLDQFGSLETISETKGELLEAIPDTGFAVLNGDDHLIRHLASQASCRVILVGENPENDVIARYVTNDDGLIRFCVDRSEFALPAVGRHHLLAATIAVAVGREIDMSDEAIAAGLAAFEAVPGRCRLLAIGDWLVIDDTYNASPASMAAACETLADWKNARKRILVVGDMLSLGTETEAFHRQLGQRIGSTSIDNVLVIGSQAGQVGTSARQAGLDPGCLGVCPDFDTLTTLLDCWLEPGDIILVKGSRGMRMEQVIDILQHLAAKNTVQTQYRKAA